MSGFRRSYSQVWWGNYWSDRGNIIANNIGENDRNSSRSQDSGFSDSESSSSPPPSSSSSSSKTTENETYRHDDEVSNSKKLPKTPIPKQGRLQKWTNNRTRVSEEYKQSDSNPELICNYLAGCYYQLKNAELTSTNYSLYDSCNSAVATPSRTCFIVDEIPKKTISNNSEIKNTMAEDSADTSTSSSYDGFKSDDTVRFVGKKENKQHQEIYQKQVDRVENVPNLQELAPSTKIESRENRLSNLDLSRLPEPTFTSTPKKEDVITPKKINKKLKNSSLKMEKNDTRTINPPVAVWLHELQFFFEEECTRMVQSKPIAQNNRVRSSDVLMITESVSSVQTFQQKTELIARKFSKLYEKINMQYWHLVEPLIITLAGDIKEFIINYSQLLPQMESTDKENALKMMDSCDHLVKLVKTNPVQIKLSNDVSVLERFFSRFVGSVLVQQVVMLFSALDQPNTETTLLNALYGISNLDLNTSGVLDIVTRLDGIQRLLSISWKSNSTQVRKASLRALEIVCQNAASIKQLEMARGIEIIADMLTDMNREESELSEVVSVLVQITAPWIEDDHVVKDLIYYLYVILNAITHLISSTNSCETLLLCSAALANILFIEPQSVFMLVKLNTVGCLLTAVRRLGVRATVFLLEQVATVVASMAAESTTRNYLAQNRVVGALLCFLQMKHTLFETDAEIAAAERVQHKSAVALSRLCTSSEICQQIVDLQGVSRLVYLCKDEKERNYNDGVLVACLTSLRKITANCGKESITSLNAKELVEPRLVDSFLLYSSRKESYV